MKRVLFYFIFLMFFLPVFSAITGEAITGKVADYNTNVSVFVEPGPPIIFLLSPQNKTYYSTQILVNYSIENNASSVWYNLDNTENITLTNSSQNSFYITTALGSHLLTIYANSSKGNSSVSSFFEVSSVETPTTTSSSGSSGGGGGGGPTVLDSFELDKKMIETKLTKGQSKTEVVLITNNLDKEITIKVSKDGLDNFVVLDKKELIFGPGETKEFKLNFFSLSQAQPGIYVGKITFASGFEEKSVNIFIDLKDSNALFDVILSVPENYKEVSAGKRISSAIEMTNIGFSGTAVDVDLNFYLTDSNKNLVVDYSRETLAVKTSLTITRQFEIPDNLKSGTYLLIVDLKYDNLTASSYDSIEVTRETKTFHLYAWLLALFVVLGLIVYFSIKLRQQIKRDTEPYDSPFKKKKNKRNKK